MMERVGGEEEFRDERVDLAELIIRIGEGLADRARGSADPKALAEAESAVRLHAQVAGEPAPSFLNRSRLPAKLNEARAAVRKARIRSETLATMDRALKSSKSAGEKEDSAGEVGRRTSPVGSGGPALPQGMISSGVMLDAFKDDAASRVYQARDALVDQYPDLAHDPALDPADDRGQRADPPGRHRQSGPSRRGRRPSNRSARAADQPGPPLDRRLRAGNHGSGRDRLRPGRRFRLRDRWDDRGTAVACSARSGLAVRASGRRRRRNGPGFRCPP